MSPSSPTPYYQQDGITIYHGDCRDILPTLEAGSVDLVLTDPPYGVGKADWDNDVWELLQQTADQCARVLSPKGVCFWFSATRYLPESLKATAAMPYRWQFIWHSSNGMKHGDIGFMNYTPALVMSHGKAWRNMQDLRSYPVNGTEMRGLGHPTPKPPELFQYIASKASPEGGLLVDPFLGSGTTVLAAARLGRRAIGIEIEERYCEIAAKRLQQSVLPLEVASCG